MRYCCTLLLLLLTGVASAQKEKVTSRFYFPGLIGTDFQPDQRLISYRSGLLLNSAVEYRPDTAIHLFYRFNYDVISNKYISRSIGLPTNVYSGSQHHTYFLVGAGYRKKYKQTAWYLLLQPGLGTRSYDIVSISEAGYKLKQINMQDPSVKIAAGFEFYLAPHFALVMESSRYQNAFLYHRNSFNTSEMAISIGFTTTLF